jgi:hypothetical protein
VISWGKYQMFFLLSFFDDPQDSEQFPISITSTNGERCGFFDGLRFIWCWDTRRYFCSYCCLLHSTKEASLIVDGRELECTHFTRPLAATIIRIWFFVTRRYCAGQKLELVDHFCYLRSSIITKWRGPPFICNGFCCCC